MIIHIDVIVPFLFLSTTIPFIEKAVRRPGIVGSGFRKLSLRKGALLFDFDMGVNIGPL